MGQISLDWELGHKMTWQPLLLKSFHKRPCRVSAKRPRAKSKYEVEFGNQKKPSCNLILLAPLPFTVENKIK